jgi:hypothetical protein
VHHYYLFSKYIVSSPLMICIPLKIVETRVRSVICSCFDEFDVPARYLPPFSPSTHTHTRPGSIQLTARYQCAFDGKNPEESKKTRVLLTLVHHALAALLFEERVSVATVVFLLLGETRV